MGKAPPEFEHGNIAQSRQYFENALRFQPDNSTILIYYAALLVRTGNASRALSCAQRAVRAAPNSADAYTMLGYAEFASDHTKDAVTSWKRSLALRPDAKVEQFLAKAPAKVVEGIRKRAQELAVLREKVQSKLDELK